MTPSLLLTVRERPWIVASGLVVLHVVVGGLAFDPVPHVGGDNAAYLALARSLLDHGRYLELWDPARPPHTQYPPGFPAILAVAWTVGLRSWTGLKLMMLGFSAVAVAVSYLWMRARTSATVAAGLGLILAVAPGVAAESQWILSDVPFWAVTVGALLALERGRTGWGIGLAVAALTLRTAGLPLVVAIVLWLGLRRRWWPALMTLSALAALGLFWTIRAPAMDTPYISQFWLENPYVPELGRAGVLDLLGRAVENAERYGLRILMRVIAGAAALPAAVMGTILVVAATVGWVIRIFGKPATAGSGPRTVATAELDDPGAAEGLRSPPAAAPPVPAGHIGSARLGVVEIFAVLYVGMLLLWPAQWASDRFLFPFLPVLLVFAAEGVSVLPGPTIRGYVRMAGAALILGFAIPPSVALWSAAADCRAGVRQWGLFACLAPEQRAFLELAEWSSGRLPDDAVVISRKPRQWYWFSGYPGQEYPFTLDRAALLEEASRLGARYVVLDELGPTSEVYLLPAVLTHRRRFCVVRRRMEPSGAMAALLGVLPGSWDPESLGIEDDAPTSGLRLPLCPALYRRDGEPTADGAQGTGMPPESGGRG